MVCALSGALKTPRNEGGGLKMNRNVQDGSELIAKLRRVSLPTLLSILGAIYLVVIPIGLLKPEAKYGLTEAIIFITILIINSNVIERLIKFSFSKEGVTLELDRKIEMVKVRQSKQEQDIKLLRFFIANFVGKYELVHLEGVERGKPYRFESVPWTFEAELVNLRSRDLIDHFPGKGIVEMKKEGQGDLNDHFYITDLGKDYLKLRREVISELKGA
jgi:hypothetical protein